MISRATTSTTTRGASLGAAGPASTGPLGVLPVGLDTCTYYYYNQRTGESKWNPPGGMDDFELAEDAPDLVTGMRMREAGGSLDH